MNLDEPKAYGDDIENAPSVKSNWAKKNLNDGNNGVDNFDDSLEFLMGLL